MRKTTTWALVVGIAATAGTGAVRAQDAEQPSTTRGTFVVAAGDKVHGFLRGGETHALRVHLAKGDVYSFSVNSQKRGDGLVMHLTFLDPSGREINGDARVDHRANGKKITVGPYKAPATGEYVIELYSQTWFSGDYWGTSKVRGARKTIVHLPADGSTVGVDVAAGSTLRLRGRVANFVMATPGADPARVGGDDALVASLRGGHLASSETGAYVFGAPGTKGEATLEVLRPQWKASTVEAPVLPDDPTRAAQFAWIVDGWKEQHEAQQVYVQQMVQEMLRQSPTAAPPAVVAVPIAVDAQIGTSPHTATLFLGADINASGVLENFFQPAQTTPPVTPPGQPDPSLDLATTADGTPIVMPKAPNLPNVFCVLSIGTSLLFESRVLNRYYQPKPTQRDTPWTRRLGEYPATVARSLMPSSVVAAVNPANGVTGDDDAVTRTFDVTTNPSDPMNSSGTVTTVARYSVDGHPARALIATGGDTTISWTVSGSGSTPGGVPFTIEGSWNLVVHGSFTVGPSRSTCTLTGEEHYSAGGVTESIATEGLEIFMPWRFASVPVGSLTRTIEAPASGIRQTMTTQYSIVWPTWLPVLTSNVTIVTIDPSTSTEGVEDDETYEYEYTC